MRRVLRVDGGNEVSITMVAPIDSTAACLDHLHKNRFVSVVTAPHAKGKKHVALDALDFTGYCKLALWFGNEGCGISDLALQHSEVCVGIPLFGIVESLNFGTTTGSLLNEVTRQRR